MKRRIGPLAACWLAFTCLSASAAEPIQIRGGACEVVLDPVTGSLLRAGMAGQSETVVRGSEHGLWRITFEDGSALAAREFSPGVSGRSLNVQHQPGSDRIELDFRSAEARVRVVVEGVEEGVDIHATVEPYARAILAFELPGRLRFDPSKLKRFVAPLAPHDGVGVALRASFFRKQAHAAGWLPWNMGPENLSRLVPDGIVMRAMESASEPIAVTSAGKAWLGDALAARLQGARVDVCRPPTRSSADLVLLDSASGPVLSASRLGGTGRFWRWGGFVRPAEAELAHAAFLGLVRNLATGHGRRTTIGLIQLENGPETGGGNAIPVASWKPRLDRLAAEAGCRVELIATVEELLRGLRAASDLAIINPYGEWLPAAAPEGVRELIDAVGRFVRQGGHWIETGGYPFYAALVPRRYLGYEAEYPPAFADFVHLASNSGSLAVYRVQPRTWQPWQGRNDPAALFTPGKLQFGGDEQGGWSTRGFVVYLPPGRPWQSPIVRLSAGHSVWEDLHRYARANALGRTLEEKLPPERFDRFRKTVLVKFNGSAHDLLESLPTLPVPTLIHFADYLHGGFDKQYPDHLPPRAGFGTEADLRAVIERAHQLGHLVMPYTNPTWWCDEPRGPTFLKAGDAPLRAGSTAGRITSATDRGAWGGRQLPGIPPCARPIPRSGSSSSRITRWTSCFRTRSAHAARSTTATRHRHRPMLRRAAGLSFPAAR